MAINFGDILGGLGAAYGGRAQEYAQGIQQREQGLTERKRAELEARQRALYEDANTAFGFLSNPELNYEQRADNIIRLAEDRLDALSNYADTEDEQLETMQVLELANQMKDGTDPTAVTRLAQILTPAYSIYQQRYAPQQEQERGVVVDGNVVNPMTGDVIYAAPPAGETVFEASPGLTRYRNGVAVQYSRDGKRRVLDDLGNVVTGEAARSAIQSGIESGVVEAGQIAAEQVQGRGLSERAQAIINTGVDAAAQIPVLTNAIGLLDEVKTGGFSAANIKLKSLLGVEAGNEGELSYLLSTNVLQQLKPIFGSAFTASEGERLTSISASIGRSPETNKRLLGEALRIARTAAEKALDRADEAGDASTVREIQNALRQLEEFEGGASTMQGGAPNMANPDLFNRADAIISGSPR
jgi:hypothetical protein